ncbi:hypothetical protein Tco_1116882 [Tanacetum coccineum]
MSIFKCPMGVLKLLESIRRNFFNGAKNSERKLALIGWKKVTASKKMKDLAFQVFSLLIEGYSLNGYGVSSPIVPLYGLGLSRPAIVQKVFSIILVSLQDVLLGLISSWINDSPLKILYPRLFLLELNKQVTVADKLREPSLTSTFRRAPRGGLEEEQLRQLEASLGHILLSQANDRRVWNLESSDKLPTRLNLSLRGVDIPSILCPLCSTVVESSSHLLLYFHLALQLMFKVVRWWEIELHVFNSYEDWLTWFNNIRLSKRLKEILEGTCYVMWWTIWNFCNQVLFGIKQPRMELLFDDIVRLSFYWCSNRCNLNFDWNSWMKCPSSMTL